MTCFSLLLADSGVPFGSVSFAVIVFIQLYLKPLSTFPFLDFFATCFRANYLCDVVVPCMGFFVLVF